MGKDIVFADDMRGKMLIGIEKVAGAVKVTLGPKGRNVAMYQKANLRDAEYSDAAMKGAPAIMTNDGVTIAKSIVLEDPVENLGAQILREAAAKVNEEAGDGTTTAVVLTEAIIREGMKNIAAGADPLKIKKGLSDTARAAKALLTKGALEVKTEEELARVARISCQEEELGAKIGQAVSRVGLEGVIKIEDSGKVETTLDVKEGIVFDRGYISPYMVTDQEKQVAELHNPYILITDEKFDNPQVMIPALMAAAEVDRPMLIICDGLEGEALGMIIRNKLEGDLDFVAVVAPLYGEGRRWRLDDLAVQTGGTFISRELGMDIRETKREMLGAAEYVCVSKNQTLITGAAGDPDKVSDRVNELRHLVENTDYEFNKERYKERLAKFVSGVAVLDVGGRTEIEIKERRFRAEDAVHAVRAACEEGIVAGGGIALLNLRNKLKEQVEGLEGDEKTGGQILVKALEAPVRQIGENAGMDGSSLVAALDKMEDGIGYDGASGQYVDMVAEGIIDPVKVTRMALECAVSVAGTLLTAEAAI